MTIKPIISDTNDAVEPAPRAWPGPPLAATFHLTHACNLRCSYCYTGEKTARPMSRETAERAIAFCLAEAARQRSRRLDIVFFGGEPLLKKDLLLWIADEFRRRVPEDGPSLGFKMSTNGTLLTRETMAALMQRRVFVSLSVDGPPETHDAQRPTAGGRGSAAALREGIAVLLEANPCANVQCVVTPQSAGRLDESVRWLAGRGFSYITTALDYGAPWTRGDMRALEAAYTRLADWYEGETRRGRKIYISCLDEKIRSWTNGPPETCERCSIGYKQFSIAPSGRLYPCVQFVRDDDARTADFVIGDVAVGGFDESRRRALNTQAEGEKAECGGCALQSRCSSWCACVNWQSTGRIDRASPVVCAHDQMLMPIADRLAERLWRGRSALFMHKFYNPAFPALNFVEDIVVRRATAEDKAAMRP